MKITGQVEQIFSHAVALDQSGGLRNTIYANKREIFILNFDHTVLVRFRLKSTENPFQNPVSFRANDYDSNEFYEEDGKIIFISEKDGFQRKKSSGKAEYEPEQVKEIFYKFIDEQPRQTVVLKKEIISLLDTDLSHIEFSGKKGEPLKMIQRNIYSGAVIEVQQKGGGYFDEGLDGDFGPIGIKTGDFQALFMFQDVLQFEFPYDEGDDYIVIRSIEKDKRDMVAVVACCLYDEIIQLRTVKKDIIKSSKNKPIVRTKK